MTATDPSLLLVKLPLYGQNAANQRKTNESIHLCFLHTRYEIQTSL